MQIVADAFEQPLTTAEKRRREVDLHLVDQSDGEILLRDIRSAGERYVFAAGGAPRLFERCPDAVGDEGECVPPSSSSGSRAKWVSTKTGW